MIRIVPTEHSIGVKLQGDFEDLNELYDALSRYLTFYQASANYQYSDYEYLLALNYDIRHAYMGTRDVVAVDNHFEDFSLLQAAKDPDIDLEEDERKKLKQYKEDFTKNNLYFSVNISVPLILYYLTAFEHILNSYYSVSWFKKYNEDSHRRTYDQMTAEHDRTQIQVFNAAVWTYLSSLLGEEETSTLFHYFSYNEEGTVFPAMYIDAVLAYYHANASDLTEGELKEFIIYIAYCIMDPISTHYKSKNMLACHDQYQKVRNDIKDKKIKLLPSYSRFLTLEDKYFGEKMNISEDEFDDFTDKYFGKPDWDNIIW